MVFTDSQKQSIAQWVAEGLKLSDIQSRINKEFEAALTYMDVRFLIDDLNLELKDQPPPVDSDLRNAPPPPSDPQKAEPLANDLEGTTAGGLVSVALHKVYQPGSIVSGEVVFSDDEKAVWALDQMGRLSLKAGTAGYQPNENDLLDFQQKLSSLLQSQGYT
ncbi:MAG: hypothetical protein O3C43_08475 [Verrucomicrobia bacterium]|nr:hypothetical protein [Verrucomicrobiota bacterium]MDA1066523.1 hypothetical protein [Verrucomicrobiota bacterium]